MNRDKNPATFGEELLFYQISKFCTQSVFKYVKMKAHTIEVDYSYFSKRLSLKMFLLYSYLRY